MQQLFYLSRAVDGLREVDVQQILTRARTNNWRVNVTGCLLFSGRHFAQVIEGAEPALQALFQKIQRDTRHSGVHVLLDQQAAQRRYADWSMGFVYSADFSDRLELALARPESSADQVLDLFSGIRIDSLMGPL